MKVKLIFTVAFIFVNSICFGQTKKIITVKCAISEILRDTVIEGESYQYLEGNLLNNEEEGMPKLPLKYIKYVVPNNSSNYKVYIEKTHGKHATTLKNQLIPIQSQLTTNGEGNKNFIKPNKSIYHSNSIYPKEMVSVVDENVWRGNKIITIGIFMCQYLPKDNKLYFADSLRVVLEYKENVVQNKQKTIGLEYVNNTNKKKKSAISFVVENPEDIEESMGETYMVNQQNTQNIKKSISTLSTTKSVNLVSANCEYIIVTTKNLIPSFSEFIRWKREKGLIVEIVAIEDVYSNYSGDELSGIYDNAGKLRQFLRESYCAGNGTLQYVLLGGDDTLLPIRKSHFERNSSQIYDIPTDLYFAEFDSNWDSDGDGLIGEPFNIDYAQEIYIGRIMVKNSSEVATWTSKLLMYEQNPGNGNSSYLTKAFFTQADQLQSGNQAEIVLNNANWIKSKQVFNEKEGCNTNTTPTFPTGKNVIDEFNKDFGFVSFMGHGAPHNVAVATQGYNSNINNTKRYVLAFENYCSSYSIKESGNGMNNMTNYDYPTVMYSISCETMPFDDYCTTMYPYRNMGESYTCMNKGGGPIYLGNTREGWIDYSYIMFSEFVKLVSNGVYHVGEAEAISKINLGGPGGVSCQNFIKFGHNLLGCPETEIWTSSLSKFNSISMTKNNSTISVDTKVSGCNICLMSANDNGESYHKVVNNVTKAVFGNVPRYYTLTITKHDYKPYQISNYNVFVQNETIVGSKTYVGYNISSGNRVTSFSPSGNVLIKKGSNVVFDAENEMVLDNGFEVELGASLEIK